MFDNEQRWDLQTVLDELSEMLYRMDFETTDCIDQLD